mmetsp:Transcript_38366/g.34181  ORF Transcript_38366/g.34181 Transcript_38366/m.34181 type:complete len:223 (+) Transcript_38366:1379-2047(+)
MCKGSNGLHFNSISLIKRMIKNTWRIDNLPLDSVEVGVTDKQRLSCEGITLDINISIGNMIHKTTLSDIGKTSNDDGSCVWVNGWHSCQMFSDFFQKAEGRTELLDNLNHSTKSGSLQHLASVKTVTMFQHSNVILGDIINQITSGSHMPKSNFVMVFVVNNVNKIGIEGMDIFKLGEAIKGFSEFFVDGFSAEFDLSHIKCSNTSNFVARMGDCRGLSLGL